MKKILILLAVSATGMARAQAGEPAFQAALTPELAIQARTNQINGVCLNLWGENPQHAFALGFINGSKGASQGFTLAWLANYSDAYTGVAWSLLNINKVNFTGWQAGALNIADGTFAGVQSGWLNLSFGKKFGGLQLGLINYAENLHGVQIGVLNLAMNNAWFKQFPDQLAPGFPVVNWSF